MARVKQLPCCNCFPQKTGTQVDHMKDGNRRIGDFYVIPLCEDCHRAVHKIRYKQWELWEETNKKLGISRERPASKIVPRNI